ncbi:LysR substrate-binding domain-containing protein [Uruburuella testudinis]|uniref:LysR substrate-binding domain-containing protein n=1 Tax=Uruburuella testudinis TaxID=1282863 RepID=A0ABY4DVG0_9NEIS|nr:LysR family transcriptional regulator [Uruburuella testudinis]UOO83030.1 LysR substrate-binding domain-containing protein [Uruburuella testudinis]
MDFFSALTIFHSVAETANFSATARQLNLAVSSVARQIDRLEQTLGVSLLNRSTRRITLTNAGIHYLQQTRAVLDELHAANLSLKQETEQLQGKLRITYPPAYGHAKLAPLLAAFARRYPHIRLEAHAADDFFDLAEGRYDLAVRVGRVGDDGLVAKYLAPQQRVLCASPDYLVQRGTPAAPSDLPQHNCLVFMPPHHTAAKWSFSHPHHGTQTVQVQGSLSTNHTELLLNYALAAIGIAHLPDWLIDTPLAQGRLVRLLPEWTLMPDTAKERDGIYLVYPPASKSIMKIKALTNFLLAELQTPQP